jgi:hypothetical protein
MRKSAILSAIILVVTLLVAVTVGCPTETATDSKSSYFSIEIVDVTSPVCPGENATLQALTTPGAPCDIEVHYKSGLSEASGLYTRTADSDGYVPWTWKVGTRTTPGSWKIVVSASYDSQTASDIIYFTVQQDYKVHSLGGLRKRSLFQQALGFRNLFLGQVETGYSLFVRRAGEVEP